MNLHSEHINGSGRSARGGTPDSAPVGFRRQGAGTGHPGARTGRRPGTGHLEYGILVGALVVASLAAALAPSAGAPAAPNAATGGRYIVVLRDDVADPRAAAGELGRAHGLAVGHVYDVVLKGFAARVPARALAGLARNPRVAYVDPDLTVRASATVPTGVDRVGADNVGGTGAGPGPGAQVAVLDTGIARHPDLTIAGGHNCTSSDASAWGDVHGHGTHVAGTIGANGALVGVAPGTPLYAVKVLGDDGDGAWSWVICGIDWVAKQGITVANLSLAGASNDDPSACGSSSLHQAICNATGRGVRFAVAAGNDDADAAGYVPAKYDQVTTVSALADADGCVGGVGSATDFGPDDTRASFSNDGAVVDVAAPGVDILSTVPGGYARMSGTSMATPHVAALFALGGYATEASGFGEPIANLPRGNTACDGAVEDTNTTADIPSEPSTLAIVGSGQSPKSTSGTFARDRDPSTAWRTSATTPRSAYVWFDLGSRQQLGLIRWVFGRSGHADAMRIQVSDDGTTWATIAGRGNAPANEWQELATDASARYVRFFFRNPNKDARLGYLSEVEIRG